MSASSSRSARQQIPDLYDLYDLAHVDGWEPNSLHLNRTCLLGWICTIYTDPARHLRTAGEDLDDLDDLSDLSDLSDVCNIVTLSLIHI